MKIQGNYINVNGGLVVTQPIEVKWQQLSDRVNIRYFLEDDFEPMRLCVESVTEEMVYDDFGNELGIMPVRKRTYLPQIILGIFEDVESEILTRINNITEQ
jgi:hypothetical protein